MRRSIAVALVAAVVFAGGPSGCRPSPEPASRAAVSTGASLPDLSAGDLRLEAGGVAVRVVAEPRPILAFETTRLLFHFAEVGAADERPSAVDRATVSFAMEMDMGPHRYLLVPATREGWLQAEVVLPACPSGNRRWYGTLAFELAGQTHSVRFQFDLVPHPN
jgi:hypothetical protein